MREEYKLVFLTVLVRFGLGTILTYLVTSFWIQPVQEHVAAFACLLVTVLGLGLSLLHVGKPTRILNTLSNRRSLMSWEAIVAPPLLTVMSLLVVCSYFYPTSVWLPVLRIGVLILAILFIYVTGKVYHLRARPSWNTPLVLYEYFTSAATMGILGVGLILVVTGNLMTTYAQLVGYSLLALVSAETIITYSYRARAVSLTVTARKALLETPSTKRLYTWFVMVGLLMPATFALLLVLGVKPFIIIPIALVTFISGALIWRVLFFRSATLIKITPDIAI